METELEFAKVPIPVTEPTQKQLLVPTAESEVHQETILNIETAIEERGNCRVINAKENLTGDFPLAESTYISVDCENIVDSESMFSKWIGFFPINFFDKDSQSNLSIGKKFDIEIEELEPEGEEEDPYKTVFRSEKFVNKSFIGVWGNESAKNSEYKEETIYEVLLKGTSSEKFYLYSSNN